MIILERCYSNNLLFNNSVLSNNLSGIALFSLIYTQKSIFSSTCVFTCVCFVYFLYSGHDKLLLGLLNLSFLCYCCTHKCYCCYELFTIIDFFFHETSLNHPLPPPIMSFLHEFYFRLLLQYLQLYYRLILVDLDNLLLLFPFISISLLFFVMVHAMYSPHDIIFAHLNHLTSFHIFLSFS